MVFSIEQSFNVQDDTTYPQFVSSNTFPWASSSSYYSQYSNVPLQYVPEIDYATKLSQHSMETSAHYDRMNEPTPSPSSPHQSLNGLCQNQTSLTSPFNAGHSTGITQFHQTQNHLIYEIKISPHVIAKYISRPSNEDLLMGWRSDHFKCNFPGCTSRAVESSRLHPHLALHLNSKKAFECSCGTKFGRLSEANRHLYDQSPCEICGDPRRKQKGTQTCNRCYLAVNTGSN